MRVCFYSSCLKSDSVLTPHMFSLTYNQSSSVNLFLCFKLLPLWHHSIYVAVMMTMTTLLCTDDFSRQPHITALLRLNCFIFTSFSAFHLPNSYFHCISWTLGAFSTESLLILRCMSEVNNDPNASFFFLQYLCNLFIYFPIGCLWHEAIWICI